MDIEVVETIDRVNLEVGSNWVQVTCDVLSVDYSTRPPNKSPHKLR